ncbi:MAG: helicase [Snowella sp.]|jgi:superfamily I DNA and RNA helicase|nr:MAG: helicase [Snowella sp.]
MVNVVRGDIDKPEASRRLASYFESRNDLEGTLYLGYPIIGTSQGGYEIDALLISREYGVIVFNLVEGVNADVDIEEAEDESVTKIQSKLLTNKSLLKRRDLAVPVNAITYAPAWKKQQVDDKYVVARNERDLEDFLKEESIKWVNSGEYFEKLNSVIQGITSIRKRGQRNYIKQENSRGAKLRDKVEASIANLDRHQSEAVIETCEGVQRIRGLAGSGKTIILALKVAYLHAKHPDWHIAVTFNTRSLKAQFRQFINTFVIETKSEEPDWSKIDIIHAWGSPSKNNRDEDNRGIYYEICKKHNIEYKDFRQAKALSSYTEAFDYVCREALQKIKKFEQYYDAILIDEAQDFSGDFLRLCYEILREPKRLIYAYDELQNLSKKIMKSPEEIFGLNDNGQPRVRLHQERHGEPKQDIILEKCYRNSRPILASAHALGFGIYRNNDRNIREPVQMFDNSGLWLDIGYEVVSGQLEDGKFVELARNSNTSPTFLENHSALDDLIIFKTFNNNQEQIDWLINEIETNLKNDELKHSDIMVIHSDPLKTEDAVGKIREELFKKGINSNLAGVSTSPDDFFDENSIIFTSIYRAKGNEAAMIYVIDAHLCFSGPELARKRNILFTAMTRSKAWLRVIGHGKDMEKLQAEYQKCKEANFVLKFTYPTEPERQKMNLINRDRSSQERNKIQDATRNAEKLVNLLERGEIHPEDLPPETLEKLKQYI